MTSLNSKASRSVVRHPKAKRRSEFTERLQRLATGVFVTGFAGALAASRLLPSASGNPAVGGFDAPAPMSSLRGYTPNASPAADRAQQRLAESRRLLLELRSTLATAQTEGEPARQETMARAREIAGSLALINRVVSAANFREAALLAEGVCAVPAGPAIVYLSTGSHQLSSGITIRIQGVGGIEQFTFASGTLQTSIIRAINSFAETHGFEAQQSAPNHARVEVRSTGIGADSLVRMWGNPVVFAEPIGGPTLFDLKDYGVNALVLQAVDYASASQSSIRAAIGTFTNTTGIDADQSRMNPDRDEVRIVETAATVVDNLVRSNVLDGLALGDLNNYGANVLVLRAIDDESQ